MPSGNGAHKQMRQARKAKQMAEEGKATTAEDRKKQAKVDNALQCVVCMTGFRSNTSEKELEQHRENKHPKETRSLEELFPGYSKQ